MLLLNQAVVAFARRLLARSGNARSVEQLLKTLLENEPTLSGILRRAILQAYLNQAKLTALPASLQAFSNLPPLRPPFGPPTIGQPEPPIRWPGVEAAARWLYSRQLFTSDDFRQLDQQAQQAAFTVARTSSIDAVRSVQGALAEAVRTGQGLPDFRETVKESLARSALGEAGVETLYRTHVGLAQAAGQRAVIEHPLVGDEFPYLLFSATHDSRTRHDHLEMESHGQNGTAIYRRDDPIWQSLWPPMGWNCRCGIVPLTIDDAARHGSREAQRWLRSGTPPLTPEWAKVPYPVIPPPGWPAHQGIQAVV